MNDKTPSPITFITSTFRLRVLIPIVLLILLVTALIARRNVSATSAAVIETTISTIAGGGFGSDVPARQAPMVLPTAVALDPRGRGFYIVDEVD